MTIIDINAFAGHCWSFPVDGSIDTVAQSMQAAGIDKCFMSSADAAWFPNAHTQNDAIYKAAEQYELVVPVPTLDPTIATWKSELAKASDHPDVRAIKLLPAYHGYELTEIADFLDAVSTSQLAAIIQTRIEDPRRQHPSAQVPDVPASEIADAAKQNPNLKTIIGGPRWAEISSLAKELKELPNLYADVSHVDGMDNLSGFVEEGLTAKLLFGSHAPFFILDAALRRVVTDLEDADAEAILGGNAAKLFDLQTTAT